MFKISSPPLSSPATKNLKSKKHFLILDGLRGVAALAVVIFHFMEWVYPDFSKNFIGHGFLAVDFFFCLSGFVVGYAYDDRIQKIGTWEFFKSRLIRLHPLIILGSVLGLLALLFDPFALDAQGYGTGRIILIFLCSIFLIPLPVMEDRAFNLFGLNAPSWSLFWEYVANIVYALVLYRLGRRYLLVVTLLAAIALGYVSYSAGNLLGGWTGENFWDGCARISYSFSMGLLIFRYNWVIKNQIGFIFLALLLSLAFVMPYFEMNWMIETAIVLFYFPLLISLGAGSSLSKRLKNFCKFSGDISYPLYMTHYAVIWMFGNYYTNYQPGETQTFLIISLGTIVLIGVAYVAMVAYDIPVRKYLNRKRK
ncbi:acyltransferase [Salinimicrobium sp. MT39]|uniref:Acyltransferase n=1 Tax=Salinimicrobium profundisediminis TaxID=2994553 RepID=A0A9X3HZZ0_9FLAO|nr:acyltransferase [Salinimicrobium profundisediminis]MCX2836989.1 acyltransferase [Salinimicrobium profundisediminis]